MAHIKHFWYVEKEKSENPDCIERFLLKNGKDEEIAANNGTRDELDKICIAHNKCFYEEDVKTTKTGY